MKDWQDRVRNEGTELAVKYNRLCAFISSEKMITLTHIEQRALERQARAMAKYLGILTERIARFE